jgi:NTE family protein
MRSSSASTVSSTRGHIALALQGGGSHGAFTWGVLHALLDDERMDWSRLAAISGTSAGAVNAAVMSAGYTKSDEKSARQNAQQALSDFWREVSEAGEANPFKPLRIPGITGTNGTTAKLLDWWSDAARAYWQQFSPYQTNPLNLNPLRELLERHMPRKAVKKFNETKLWQLHLGATNVITGEPMFFTGDDVTVESVLASACLPSMFHAIEIGGKHYWDGGYSSNPPIAPLIVNRQVDAIVLVTLDATHREGVPQSAADIVERELDISFAAPLNAELRVWQAMLERLRDERQAQASHTLPTLEVITSKLVLNQLDAASKLETDAQFLLALFEAGKLTAQRWLKNPPQI